MSWKYGGFDEKRVLGAMDEAIQDAKLMSAEEQEDAYALAEGRATLKRVLERRGEAYVEKLMGLFACCAVSCMEVGWLSDRKREA